MRIKGIVKEVRFASAENGFHILVMECDSETVIAVGTFPPIKAAEFLELEGEFTVHPRFGKQFKANKISKTAPSSIESMRQYLAGGLIKGVGEKTAEAIIVRFGLKSLEVIEKNPKELSKIKGISLAKALRIKEEYVKHKAVQETVMFLQSLGVTINTALKIHREYGEGAVSVVMHNPYKLVEDIDGIGFVAADAIALKLGIEKDSPFRLEAGIICALKESAERSGNTFLFREEIISEAQKLLKGEWELDGIIDNLIIGQKLRAEEIGNDKAIYLKKIYLAENNAAISLIKLLNSCEENTENVDSEINDYEKTYGIEFNNGQKEAIGLALNKGVCAITGGPGTGKTTIIKCLINLFENREMTVLLMAPTGRAAKRMNESTGRQASTIHRALMQGGGLDFSRQLNTDVVIVDEVSMMDIFLFNMLLRCTRDGTKLIMLGDSDQLPSVGAGNVLSDVLGRLPSVRLNQIYRQASESLIITNAHRINGGIMPDLGKKDADFFFIFETNPSKMAEIVADLVLKRLPQYLNAESERIQVLCPMKNGAAGTINLNRILSARLSRGRLGKEIDENDNSFKEGDRVMQISNNYQQEWVRDGETGEGVFNGDMGTVVHTSCNPKEMEVLFEDGRRSIYQANTDELTLCYAVTVHKSQGSEFDAAIIPLVPSSPAIMTRNLLYTAITRAKKLVVLVGGEYTIKKMVENNYIAKRNSGLKHFIDKAQKDYNKLFKII